jgi:hypothetical protein
MTPGFYKEVIAGLNKSTAMERYLESNVDDAILQTKTAHDVQLFARIKEAALGELLHSPVARTLGKATAVAAPATAGGAYLLHRGGEEARETASDVRNKALQTALGVGGIGAGLMALHHFTQPNTMKTVHARFDPATGEMMPVSGAITKRSSVEDSSEVLLEKLATVGFLDTLLEEQEKHADSRIRDDAHACRLLNAEHGIDILRQLLP